MSIIVKPRNLLPTKLDDFTVLYHDNIKTKSINVSPSHSQKGFQELLTP